MGGLMLSTIVSKIIIIFDEAHLHEKMQKTKMLQVEQWVKDIKLPKEKRSRILTFFRRQAAQPYDEGKLMEQLPFEMRCLVARVGDSRAVSHTVAVMAAPAPAVGIARCA
eukprot:1190283-Prorocentrum_minimum.AAC.4